MNPLREWAQHLIVRGLVNSETEELSRQLIGKIKKNWFTSDRYKKIFSLLKEEYAETGKIPVWKSLLTNPSLKEEESRYIRAKEIKRKSNAEDDSSLEIPSTLEEYNGLIARLKHDCRHVSLINLHNRVSQALEDENITSEELDDLEDTLVNEITRISEAGEAHGEHVSLTPKSARKIIQKAYKNIQDKFFIPTGFKAFDSVNMGIPSSSLFTILGKSGSGKSTLALNICVNAKKEGARVCFVPLEMSIDEMILKLGALLLHEPLNELTFSLKKHYKRLIASVDSFLGDPGEDGESCFDFYVPETEDTVKDVLNHLQPYGYDVICIDYPKLLSSGTLEEWKALDKGAAFAKRFASRNRCYVLWISQMDDVTENIRYSKAVMEHASNAWAIMGDVEEIRESGQVLIKQRKARGQVPMSFNLKCDLACSYFGDMEDEGIGSGNKPRKKKKKEDEIEEDNVPTTKDRQDKTKVTKTKNRVSLKIGPGMDSIESKKDIFNDVPEDL